MARCSQPGGASSEIQLFSAVAARSFTRDSTFCDRRFAVHPRHEKAVRIKVVRRRKRLEGFLVGTSGPPAEEDSYIQ